MDFSVSNPFHFLRPFVLAMQTNIPIDFDCLLQSTENYVFLGLQCTFKTYEKEKTGKGGIRTLGSSRYDGFQNRCNRPLCHLSSLERVT